MTSAPVIGIARHRIATDGEGVTTLVGFAGCTLRCAYCLNPQSLREDRKWKEYTPGELLEAVAVDDLYFTATGGGITFGGGEPLLRADFIAEFASLCPREWRIWLETALNVPPSALEKVLGVADGFIIDVKDMAPERYLRYTGAPQERVRRNLELLAGAGRAGDCRIRVPVIPGYNDGDARERSAEELAGMGFGNFDRFTYTTEINK